MMVGYLDPHGGFEGLQSLRFNQQTLNRVACHPARLQGQSIPPCTAKPKQRTLHEPLFKLSPLISPIVVPYITPYMNPFEEFRP